MAQDLLDASVQGLVQALDDVTALMDLAALDGGGEAEGPADCLGERLGAVDDEEAGNLGIEAAGGQIVEEGLDGGGILSRPLGDGQHVLCALAGCCGMRFDLAAF